MSLRTCEALDERKLNSWMKKGIITEKQRKDILDYCKKYGFWNALGYTTRIKYKNNPQLKKKYRYKFIRIPKKECLLVKIKTTGVFSTKRRKRIRRWRDIFYNSDGTKRIDRYWYEWDKYPDWEIFLIDRKRFIVGLRQEIK